MKHDTAQRVTPMAMLAFSTLGVVYGDIGTSVLYAVKECFHLSHGLEPNLPNVLGIMSLFFWSLLLVVVGKYLLFVMRADNRGEGGILALLALVTPRNGAGTPNAGRLVNSRTARAIVIAGLIGAALLAADGTITPAISVLSAVEGLEIAAPGLHGAVLPITVIILIALFWMQRHGTATVARIFAPAMLVWFICIAVMALPAIFDEPRVLMAINPYYGFKLLITHGWRGFLVLGSVVLCITGAEALYADMGHFGRKPIQVAWLGLVLPSLVINYFGQGALLIAHGEEVVKNPFFALAPASMIYPLIALSTIATVIASQALISGSFSLAQQAVQLGYSPRLTVVHTSGETKGQIYIPEVNTALAVACVLLALMFRTSSSLAAAYGISVMGTMTITSVLTYFVAVKRWRWPRPKAMALLAAFFVVDIPYLVANLPKVIDGGWFPLVICLVVFTIMITWKRGRISLAKRMTEHTRPIKAFVEDVHKEKPHRVNGTAVFMTGNLKLTPPALTHHFEHNQVLHEQVVLLSIITEDVPHVPAKDSVEVVALGEGFFEVVASYGFMQSPKIDQILRTCRSQFDLRIDVETTTFFLGRDVLLTDGPDRMAHWRKKLFAFLSRNSLPATAYFGIPPDRVIEMGMQVRL